MPGDSRYAVSVLLLLAACTCPPAITEDGGRDRLVSIGTGMPVASHLALADTVVLAGDFAFVGSSSAGRLWQVDLGRREAEQFADGLDNVRAIAATDATIFAACPDDVEGVIWAIDRSTRHLEQIASNQARPSAIVADGSGVYWSNSSNGTVMRFDIGTRRHTAIAVDQAVPWELQLVRGGIAWLNRGRAMADGGWEGAAVLMWEQSKGETRRLAHAVAPFGLAVSGDFVLWSDGRGVMRVPLRGGVVDIVAQPVPGARSVAAPQPDLLVIATAEDIRLVSVKSPNHHTVIVRARPVSSFQAIGPTVYWLGGMDGTLRERLLVE